MATINDVKLNNVSIVNSEGVANISYLDSGKPGVVAGIAGYGTGVVTLGSGIKGIGLNTSTDANITARSAKGTNGYGAITTANYDSAVKAHLTDGVATAYSDVEKEAARARLGVIENVIDGEGVDSIKLVSAASTNTGDSAVALGNAVVASGVYSFAEGYQSKATGEASHAEGYSSTASSTYAHAEGNTTIANASAAHAEGTNSTASGASSHAEGSATLANGVGSHAEGQQTQALGVSAHAEGHLSIATGDYSHVEGFTNKASAEGAHAEGENTVANGFASHVEGFATTAAADYQHVQGQLNVADSEGLYADIVGWGETSPKNISSLTTTGDLHLAGNVYVKADDDGKNGIQLQTKLTAGNKIAISSEGEISIAGRVGEVGDVLVDGISVLDSEGVALIDLSGKQNNLIAGAYIILASDGTIAVSEDINKVVDVLVNGASVLDSEGIADIDLGEYATITFVNSEDDNLRIEINEERVRALLAESALADLISSEGSRAAQIEAELLALINSEGDRAIASEIALNDKILAEEARAVAKEALIINALDSESNRAILAEESLEFKITSEGIRARLAEDVLQANIDSEALLARAAEALLQLEIDSEGALSRARDEVLQLQLDSEAVEIQNLKDTKQDNLVLGNNLEFTSEGTLANKIKFEYDPSTGILNIFNW